MLIYLSFRKAALAARIGKCSPLPPAPAEESKTAVEAFDEGRSCVEKDDFDAAIAAISPNRFGSVRAPPTVLATVATFTATKGELDKALADFDEAVRLSPDFDAAYMAVPPFCSPRRCRKGHRRL